MNRNIKRVVYETLKEDKTAREDTWYLIQQVVIKMTDCNAGTAFGIVLQGMKYNGISFEAITRQKRKFFEEHPEYLTDEIEDIRRSEEDKYHFEFIKHIPRID